MRSEVTKRDIPGGMVLLVGAGFAAFGKAAHLVGDGLEWCAWWCLRKAERR